jgi:hypothetical protein
VDLKTYFDQTEGHGVLATADSGGLVNLAVFARPHVMDDNSLAFIMPDRLTHANLQSNPKAAYLFLETGPGYKGKRLFLTKIREEQDSDLLYTLRRKTYPAEQEKKEGPRFLVFFNVDKSLPAVGVGEDAEKI